MNNVYELQNVFLTYKHTAYTYVHACIVVLHANTHIKMHDTMRIYVHAQRHMYT